MEKSYFEDFEVGERTITPGRTITEADIHAYAALTGDWHPLHTDVTYAKKTPFGERIAHGMLTLIIGSNLIYRLGMDAATPKGFIAYYGYDKIRFPVPVKIGDTIRAEFVITELLEKDDKKGIITTRIEIYNQRDEIVCVSEGKMACARIGQGGRNVG